MVGLCAFLRPCGLTLSCSQLTLLRQSHYNGHLRPLTSTPFTPGWMRQWFIGGSAQLLHAMSEIGTHNFTRVSPVSYCLVHSTHKAKCGIMFSSLIAGLLSDWTGSYDATFYTAGIGIFVSGVMLFAIPYLKRRTQRSKRHTDVHEANGHVTSITSRSVSRQNSSLSYSNSLPEISKERETSF